MTRYLLFDILDLNSFNNFVSLLLLLRKNNLWSVDLTIAVGWPVSIGSRDSDIRDSDNEQFIVIFLCRHITKYYNENV